jgi:hypothetical protein
MMGSNVHGGRTSVKQWLVVLRRMPLNKHFSWRGFFGGGAAAIV